MVASGCEFNTSLWLVMGDFNAISNHSEYYGASLDWPSWKDELGLCFGQAGLADVQFSGCRYTWHNKQIDSPI